MDNRGRGEYTPNLSARCGRMASCCLAIPPSLMSSKDDGGFMGDRTRASTDEGPLASCRHARAAPWLPQSGSRVRRGP